MTDPFKHMEEAWKIDGNPFPPEGIRSRPDEPYSRQVFAEETDEFCRKLIRGAISGHRAIGFLWSRGPGGADTGYGKTTLMQVIAQEINTDMGAEILRQAGVSESRLVPIVATYSNLNNIGATGLYPVLFNAVDAAARRPGGGGSTFDKAWHRIADAISSEDAAVIRSRILSAWLDIAPGGVPLRSELLTAFSTGQGTATLNELAQVSQASRLRNGIQYLDFLLAILAAANIHHLFIFVDQLEDLAINKSITSSKRSREIGRIRDLMEKEPYNSRIHFVFTFHNSAARVLAGYWEANRLPRFEIAPDNTASIVVLTGIKEDERVAELLRVYLASRRSDKVDDELLPFERDTLAVLRRVSQGRVGILLARAHELFHAAAERGLPRINGKFSSDYFSGRVETMSPSAEDEQASVSDVVDDLLR
jgi:hypothetical protein